MRYFIFRALKTIFQIFCQDLNVSSISQCSQVNVTELKSNIDWEKVQGKDSEIKQIIELIRKNSSDKDWLNITNGRRWLHERKKLYLSSNILMHESNKIVCPDKLKTEILHHYHDSPLSGHRAYETTLVAIRNRYYWNYLPSEVKIYCQSCSVCQRYNYACLHNRAPLKSIEVFRPWQLLGLDLMGPFKCSRHGNSYIILGIDHLTKYAEGVATPSFDATTTALFVFNNIIC
jgi:hypothetical protein